VADAGAGGAADAGAAYTKTQIPLIITGLGQFSAAAAREANKVLVRGVHRPGPSRQSESVRGAEHTRLGFKTKLSRL
jgi:hypothetical protein